MRNANNLNNAINPNNPTKCALLFYAIKSVSPLLFTVISVIKSRPHKKLTAMGKTIFPIAVVFWSAKYYWASVIVIA